MTSDSEQSQSSRSDGSGAEGGHPIDEVLSRRAAKSAPKSIAAPEQELPDGSTAAGHCKTAYDGVQSDKKSDKKRPLEDASTTVTTASKQRRRTAGPETSRGASPLRQQSPESGEVLPGNAYSLEDDIEAAIPTGSESTGSESGYSSGTEDEDGQEDSDDVSDASPAGSLAAPQGVIVMQNGEEHQRNAEVRRLLRMPRYFDPDYEEAGLRCFKCGGKGHMARDCTNQARDRPCFLCAQIGHDSRACPNSLCFRCNRPGHIARDCPFGYKSNSWDESGPPVCLRCGREDCPCAGQRDYIRAEGGCQNDYSSSDLNHVRCSDCSRRGHLGCKAAPTQPSKLSCYNCGEGGHTADECWKETTSLVSRERIGSKPNLDRPLWSSHGSQLRGNQASSSGYQAGYSSGYSGGGRSSQQQYGSYGGSGRYSVQQSGYAGRQPAVAPKYSNYHYAAEIDQRYQSSGTGQRRQERYVEDYNYNYSGYDEYSRSRGRRR